MNDLRNPYAPPGSHVHGSPELAADLVDAKLGRRFLNLFVDYLGSIFLMFVAAVVMQLSGVGVPHGQLANQAFAIGTMLAYYLFFEGIFGRTPGKLVTGTRVVTRDGGTPRFRQIAARTFARFVPFEPLSFLTQSRTGWHDDWSKTRVVMTK
jgi:uncharacterized RDD family membrane protein YckC